MVNTPSVNKCTTVASPQSVEIKLSSARKALHNVSDLPCREKELEHLGNFLTKHLENESSGSMYISGLPGTGKTAALSFVIQHEKIKKGFNIVFVNCTAVQSAGSVFTRICEQLKIKTAAKTEKGALSAIEKYLLRKHKMVLLILDEIDQLESKFQSVLYSIFEWPSRKKGRIVLVGIANAVDMTDRMLPRLYADVTCQPILLHFAPYTKEQIATILKHRLQLVGETDLFAPGALELISAKVAGQSGDVRRALDLGRRVLEISKTPNTRTTNNKGSTDRAIQQPNETIPRSRKSQRQLFSDSVTTPHQRSPMKPRALWNDQNNSPRKMASEDVSQKVFESSPRKRRSDVENDTPSKTPTKNKTTQLKLGDLGTPSRSLSVLNENVASPIKVRISPRKRVNLLQSPVRKRDNISPAKRIENSPLRKSPRKSAAAASPIKNNAAGFSIRALDVLKVVNEVYGSARNLKTDESAFPLHQKIVVCSLMLIISKARNRDVTIGKLHEVYNRVCTKRSITPVDQSGFIFLCRQVEMTGAITVGKGPPRMAKITLQWDQSEVEHALQDSSLLASIMKDTSTLSK